MRQAPRISRTPDRSWRGHKVYLPEDGHYSLAGSQPFPVTSPELQPFPPPCPKDRSSTETQLPAGCKTLSEEAQTALKCKLQEWGGNAILPCKVPLASGLPEQAERRVECACFSWFPIFSLTARCPELKEGSPSLPPRARVHGS